MRVSLAILCCITVVQVKACFCEDFGVLNKQECGKYEVIFLGTVKNFTPCSNHEGKVLFSISEPYKGEVLSEQELIFNCKSLDCPIEFLEGEEWLIFCKKNNAQDLVFDPCSRSRKLLPDSLTDYFTEISGKTFFQEQHFLQSTFPLASQKGILKAKKYEKVDPKLIPIFLGVSLLFMLLGIFIMRYLKKKKA